MSNAPQTTALFDTSKSTPSLWYAVALVQPPTGAQTATEHSHMYSVQQCSCGRTTIKLSYHQNAH